MTNKEAQEQFKEFCKSRVLENFDSIAQIWHQDGSTFVFHNASVWLSDDSLWSKPEGETTGYIGISTEHCGDHFFHAGDLGFWYFRGV